MATPMTSGPVTAVPLSGYSFIDSLVGGSKWGGSVGTGTTLTFSFPQGGSYWSTDPTTGYGSLSGGGEPWNSFGLTSVQQSAFRSALQKWANVANISFSESVDNQTTVGDIRASFTYNLVNSAEFVAYGYLPSGTPKGGDIWLDANDYWTTFNAVNSGSYGFLTLLHESGHALGLKHPFEGATVLPSSFNEVGFTVMSYTAEAGYPASSLSFYPTTPMWFDIEAMQYIYGPNMSYHSGNDTYVYYANQNYFETIWDAGGTDTIQYVSSFQGGTIDLRPGHWSDLGLEREIYTSSGTLVSSGTVNIYGTVTIENAVGGDGPDTIIGNDVANLLKGGGGNDTISGGPGNDSIEGGDGNDRLEGGPGNDRFDWESSNRADDDTFVGGPGDDTYVVYGDDLVTENAAEGIDTIWSATTFSIEFVAHVENLLLFDDQPALATGNGLDNVIWGNTATNFLDGKSGNDSLYGGGGNDILVGGAGIDTAVFTGNRAASTITKTTSGYTVSGPEGTDMLLNVERVQFSDNNLAFDLGTGEAAGNTVRIIGAAFDAPAIQQHPDYVGIGLNLFDSGMSMRQVAQLAIGAMGYPSNGNFVDTVYQNVVGVPPSAAQHNYYVGLLQGSGGTMTQADLLVLAANADVNTVNINLVGLQQSGVEFV